MEPTKTMTFTEIREKLGLIPFDEFEYDVFCKLAERSKHLPKRVAIEERYRQTGRTTKMLIEAIVYALSSEEEVIVIFGFAFLQKKMLKDMMISMLQKLEIPFEPQTNDKIKFNNGAIVKFASKDTAQGCIADQYYYDRY